MMEIRSNSMSNCSECGSEITETGNYCSNCGAELSGNDQSAGESFVERYGAEPLPLASERSEFISLYGSLLSSIPLLGGFLKLFAGISFWCYSLWLKVFSVITMGADVTKRFIADFNYLKDSFYSGYDGSEGPPEPPE
jgi:hypothetical protein